MDEFVAVTFVLVKLMLVVGDRVVSLKVTFANQLVTSEATTSPSLVGDESIHNDDCKYLVKLFSPIFVDLVSYY